MPITKKSRFLTPFSSQQNETKSSSKVVRGKRGTRSKGWSPVRLSSKQTVITPGTKRLIKQRLSSYQAKVEDDQSSIVSSGIPCPFDLSQSQGNALSQAPNLTDDDNETNFMPPNSGDHDGNDSEEFDLMLSQESHEDASQSDITDHEISNVEEVQSQTRDKQSPSTKSLEQNNDKTDSVSKNNSTIKAAAPAFRKKCQQNFKATRKVNKTKDSCIAKKRENPTKNIFKEERIEMIRRDVLTVIMKMRDEIQELQLRRRKLKSSGNAQKIPPTQGKQLAARSKVTAMVGGKGNKPTFEE